jgi:hypothetical protein
LPQHLDVQPFQVDHIRARKHSGPSSIENLALVRLACNSYKGANAAGFDPISQTLQLLFNPRLDDWDKHFVWDGPVLRRKSAIGRVTIEVLRINLDERVEHRRLLIAAGAYSPVDGR